MTKRIFQSTMLVAGVILAASLVIIMGCLYAYFDKMTEQQLNEALTLAKHGVEKNGMDYLEELNSTRYRLTWISETGSVIYDTQVDAGNMENHGDREEIQKALEHWEGGSSRYSTTLLERTLYQAVLLNDGSILRASISHATAWGLVMGMIQPIIYVLIAALILSGILANQVSKRIINPLNRLNLEHPLENDVYEELTPLLTRIHQQRQQIERQVSDLRRKSDEFAQITRSMNEGLVLLNQKGVILNINPAAMKLFHMDDTCIDKDFLTMERNADVNHALRGALTNGHSEVCLERDGKEYQLLIRRIESDGSIIGAVMLSFDISDQALAQRTRREFTANVSHELKTPLQSIMGSAELIENGIVKPEDLPRFVAHIHTESKRLLTLIEDIIRLSQLDEAQELPFAEVELRSMADEVADTLQTAALKKNIAVTVAGKEVRIQSVRQLIYEIVYNLCDNAIKYNKNGGSVEIDVHRQDKNAILTIKDTGIGIPIEHQERIFERFYRVDKSHSKDSGGTGLGLSIVKHAVKYLGGAIELKSQPGEGTVIQVTLSDMKQDKDNHSSL